MKLSTLFEYGMASQQAAQQAQAMTFPWEGIDRNGRPVDLKVQVTYNIDTETNEVENVRVTGVEYNGQMFSQFQAERMFKANSGNPNEQLFEPQLMKDSVVDELALKQPTQKPVDPIAKAVDDMFDRNHDYHQLNPR